MRDIAVVTQCRFISIGSHVERLVVTSNQGVHIYNASSLVQICEHLPESPAKESTKSAASPSPPEEDFFFRGIAGFISRPFLLVGSSLGEVLLFHHKGSRIGIEDRLTPHRNPITCLATSTLYLASADDFGGVKVHDLTTREVLMSYASSGAGCAALIIRGEMVVAGFVNGVIRIYYVLMDGVKIEIAAHARAVTSLDIHPFDNLMVSGGEDCYINIWEIEQSKNRDARQPCRASLVQSVQLEDSVVTGCAFAKGGSSAIAVASYDSKSISILAEDETN